PFSDATEMPVTLAKCLPKVPLRMELDDWRRSKVAKRPQPSLLITLFRTEESVRSTDEPGFACFFSLGLGNWLVRPASHEAFKERRGHQCRQHRHNHQRGEKALRYDAALEPDIDNDQFH